MIFLPAERGEGEGEESKSFPPLGDFPISALAGCLAGWRDGGGGCGVFGVGQASGSPVGEIGYYVRQSRVDEWARRSDKLLFDLAGARGLTSTDEGRRKSGMQCDRN